MRVHIVAVLVAAVALCAGCQLRVGTDVVVEPDGGGEVTLTVVVDDELRDALDDAQVDVRDGLAAAATGASWSVRTLDEPDATGVELVASFDDPAELESLVAALGAGLGEDDGALLRDVRLGRTDDGGYTFQASAGLDPPRVPGTLPLTRDQDAGVEGPTEAATVFDGAALGELLASSGDRYASAQLRVRMPTVPEAPGATVEATTATWELPVDGLRTVTATSPPVPLRLTPAVVAAAAVGVVVLGVFAIRRARRR